MAAGAQPRSEASWAEIYERALALKCCAAESRLDLVGISFFPRERALAKLAAKLAGTRVKECADMTWRSEGSVRAVAPRYRSWRESSAGFAPFRKKMESHTFFDWSWAQFLPVAISSSLFVDLLTGCTIREDALRACARCVAHKWV